MLSPWSLLLLLSMVVRGGRVSRSLFELCSSSSSDYGQVVNSSWSTGGRWTAQLQSISDLSCAIHCASLNKECEAYAVRPTDHGLFTCRLFNRSDQPHEDHHLGFRYFVKMLTLESEMPFATVAPPTPVSDPRPTSVRGGMVQVNGYKYYSSYVVWEGRVVKEELVSRSDAEANCSRMGLQLVSIGSQAEQKQIQQVIYVSSGGGRTTLSDSFQEFWTSANCSGRRHTSCSWTAPGELGSRVNISQQSYTNWLDVDLNFDGVTVDTMSRSEWRRRWSRDLVWYLCDDGSYVPPPTPTTTPSTRDGDGRGGERDHYN